MNKKTAKASSRLKPEVKIQRTDTIKEGAGVLARAPLKAGELLVVWGGSIVAGEQLAHISSRAGRAIRRLLFPLFAAADHAAEGWGQANESRRYEGMMQWL